jgi:hypothetical protein
MTPEPLPALPEACRQLADDAMAVCADLLRAGCGIQAAHTHTGAAAVLVDRRPPLPDLVPGCLRCDRSGRDYRARLGEVIVQWHEPPRREAWA